MICIKDKENMFLSLLADYFLVHENSMYFYFNFWKELPSE